MATVTPEIVYQRDPGAVRRILETLPDWFGDPEELHLIAVDPASRGRGVGHALVDRIAADLVEDGCVMMSVRTVEPSFDSEPYAQTRSFYKSVGFVPLEEHNDLDWAGSTLILVRPLVRGGR